MPEIESEVDLFNAGGQWTVGNVVNGLSNYATPQAALTARFGNTLTASPETISNFASLVTQSMKAANIIATGGPLTAADIPVIQIEGVSSQFLTQGIVSVIAEDLGTELDPFESTVPWQTQTQTAPTLAEIAAGIDTAVGEPLEPGSPKTPEMRKRAEKAEYIRGRGEPVEYDLVPLYAWRTH